MLPFFSYNGKSPKIHKKAMISSLAVVIGNVEISEGTAVFPGAVIRGDVAKISIGKFSNIQDNVVIHGGDLYKGDILSGHLPVEIGDYVTVAHGAVVHGSKIKNVVMIGIRAIVFESAVIEEGSIVGMNATVLENSRFPRRSVIVGTPAKVVKNIDDVTYSRIKNHALWYYELGKSYKGILF